MELGSLPVFANVELSTNPRGSAVPSGLVVPQLAVSALKRRAILESSHSGLGFVEIMRSRNGFETKHVFSVGGFLGFVDCYCSLEEDGAAEGVDSEAEALGELGDELEVLGGGDVLQFKALAIAAAVFALFPPLRDCCRDRVH